jgi:hypothetical protein
LPKSAVDLPGGRDRPNNLTGRYDRTRGYLGKTEPHNDIAGWAYADLPNVFRPGTSARSFVVKTSRDPRNTLGAPNDTMILIESIMDPHDAPADGVSAVVDQEDRRLGVVSQNGRQLLCRSRSSGFGNACSI